MSGCRPCPRASDSECTHVQNPVSLVLMSERHTSSRNPKKTHHTAHRNSLSRSSQTIPSSFWRSPPSPLPHVLVSPDPDPESPLSQQTSIPGRATGEFSFSSGRAAFKFASSAIPGSSWNVHASSARRSFKPSTNAFSTCDLSNATRTMIRAG